MPSSAAYSCFENVLWRIRKTHCAEAEFGSVNKIFFTAADHFVRVRSYDDHHRFFPFLIKRFDADQVHSLAHHLFLMLKVDRAPEPCTQQPDIGLIAEQVFLLCFCFCFCFFFVFFFHFECFSLFCRGNWFLPSFPYKTKQAIRLVTLFLCREAFHGMTFLFRIDEFIFHCDIIVLVYQSCWWIIQFVFAFPAKWPVLLVEALLLFLFIILVLNFFVQLQLWQRISWTPLNSIKSFVEPNTFARETRLFLFLRRWWQPLKIATSELKPAYVARVKARPRKPVELKEYIQHCDVCLARHNEQGKELLTQHDFAARPWSKVAADLCRLERRTLLVISDYYSNFIEVARITAITARSIIKKLKPVTDNGPQFVSSEFSVFARTWEFEHVTSSPTYAQSNGKAEGRENGEAPV